MKRSDTDEKLAAVLAWVATAVLVLLPFHALLTTWVGSNFGHLDLAHIWKEIIIVAMVPPSVWLAWRQAKLKYWLLHAWLPRLIYLYILLHTVLGVWALHSHQVNAIALIYALLVNLRFLGFFLVMIVIGAYSSLVCRHWVKILLWPAVVVVSFGLLQRFVLPFDFLKHFGYGKNTIPAYQTVDSNLDYRRLQSTLRGANPLGAYLVLIIPAIWVALKRIPRLVWLASSLVVLFYSYSRSAYVGTGLALLLLAYLTFDAGWLKKKSLVAGLVILAVALSGIYVFGSSQSLQDTFFHTSSKTGSTISSNAARVAAEKTALHEVVNQPLGRGPGTAGPASFRNNHPARIAENYYLQLGQELGLAGMGLFVAINIMVGRVLYKLKEDKLALILLVSLVGISFINLVSHAWTDDTLSLIWWGLAGVAIVPAILTGKGRTNAEQP